VRERERLEIHLREKAAAEEEKPDFLCVNEDSKNKKRVK
jgi:hypothetical protein